MKMTIFVTCGVLAMCLAAPAKADTLPVDTSLAHGYGRIGTATFTDPLLAFSISDGAQAFNLSHGIDILLVTGSEGRKVSWFDGACGARCSSDLNIDIWFGLPARFGTGDIDGSTQGSSGTVLAHNTNDPGKWTSVPEPSSLLMLGVGILGLAGLSLKRSPLAP